MKREIACPEIFPPNIRQGILITVFVLFMAPSWFPGAGIAGQVADARPPVVEQPSIIRVNTNLVTVPVSVMDSSGRAVGNLGIQDFVIEEDGRPETISKMAEEGQSFLRLALLFDLSGSTNSRFHFEQQAAKRFVERIWRPGDSAGVVTFSVSPKIHLRDSGSLTDIIGALSALEPTENPTSFFDAIVLSAKMLGQSAGTETRRAIIAISDGEDNKSKNNLQQALNEMHRSDAVFYSINPAGASTRLNEISSKGQADMSSLATETGGSAFISDGSEDLADVFDRIMSELRAQYLLSYYSTNSILDGKYRRISVSVPGRQGLLVRSRRGYLAEDRKYPPRGL